MRKDIDLSLYLVTDRDLSLGRSLEEVVSEAVAGGVTIVQLREKEASTGEFIALARRLMTLLRPLGIPLVINDRVDVALAVISPWLKLCYNVCNSKHLSILLYIIINIII